MEEEDTIQSGLEQDLFDESWSEPELQEEGLLQELEQEIFEPEQVMMVSIQDVDLDNIVSSDIIYFDAEDQEDSEGEFEVKASMMFDEAMRVEDESEKFNEIDPSKFQKRISDHYKGSVMDSDLEEDDMVADESHNSFIVYPSNYIAGFDELDYKLDDELDNEVDIEPSEVDTFVTSAPDTNPVEVMTSVTEDLVTHQNIQDVMTSNTRIVSLLQNTLQMQSALFKKFFGYIG